MDIYILNKNSAMIRDYLKRDLPGYNIKVYQSAEDFYDYVTHTAVLADMFIITDNGIAKEGSDLSTGFSYLKKLLEYEFFEPKTVIFLNKTDNEEHYSKYDFIKRKRIKNGLEAEIISRPVVEVNDLRDIITRSTATFRPQITNKKAVVQVKRGSKTLSTKVIPSYSSEETIAIALNKIDSVSHIVKENHMYNTTPLGAEDESDNYIEDLPEDFEITFQEVKPEHKHVKYIVTTGDGGSGVSTTALTMALNGSMGARTLLIDADTFLGLSHMVENLIPANKYYNIDLERVLIDKDDAIEDIINTEDSPNLHVMTITLPSVRAIGHEAIEYIILNLLSLIQESYKYIVIDLPFRVINKYSTLLSRADLILASCPPYLNKTVALLGFINSSTIIKSSKAYKNGLLMAYMTGMPDLNGFNPISIKEFKVYSENILGSEIPCTNPYICMNNQYITQDRFRAIIDRADTILNRKEVL